MLDPVDKPRDDSNRQYIRYKVYSYL
ncbi:MAG TPA: hypothetical protein LFV90_07030 [Rickettsia endosymbiont of Columbicola hoogstraali]|nr:hypothetical protein [Rickettsia endosymbiont of Columbicola hoogstraali]